MSNGGIPHEYFASCVTPCIHVIKVPILRFLRYKKLLTSRAYYHSCAVGKSRDGKARPKEIGEKHNDADYDRGDLDEVMARGIKSAKKKKCVTQGS
ncbi:hypothetical protein OUZ56_003116 [Daphnia magna]|uniref:Uncharacterized protein n=1 Tax=Daphnia magna TaxID=35525 RepID=A0ABR0A7S3_9CRUS|nr:hypothetical protein OUZ56_003116 [Daphnia magna]